MSELKLAGVRSATPFADTPAAFPSPLPPRARLPERPPFPPASEPDLPTAVGWGPPPRVPERRDGA